MALQRHKCCSRRLHHSQENERRWGCWHRRRTGNADVVVTPLGELTGPPPSSPESSSPAALTPSPPRAQSPLWRHAPATRNGVLSGLWRGNSGRLPWYLSAMTNYSNSGRGEDDSAATPPASLGSSSSCLPSGDFRDGFAASSPASSTDGRSSRGGVDECAVCLEPLRRRKSKRTPSNGEVEALPCAHTFHAACIDGLYRAADAAAASAVARAARLDPGVPRSAALPAKCPLCRAELPSRKSFPVPGRKTDNAEAAMSNSDNMNHGSTAMVLMESNPIRRQRRWESEREEIRNISSGGGMWPTELRMLAAPGESHAAHRAESEGDVELAQEEWVSWRMRGSRGGERGGIQSGGTGDYGSGSARHQSSDLRNGGGTGDGGISTGNRQRRRRRSSSGGAAASSAPGEIMSPPEGNVTAARSSSPPLALDQSQLNDLVQIEWRRDSSIFGGGHPLHGNSRRALSLLLPPPSPPPRLHHSLPPLHSGSGGVEWDQQQHAFFTETPAALAVGWTWGEGRALSMAPSARNRRYTESSL